MVVPFGVFRARVLKKRYIPPKLKTVIDVIFVEVSFKSFLPGGDWERRKFERFSKTVDVRRDTGLVETTLDAIHVVFFDCGT